MADLRDFLCDETGATTVDWVVLAAAIIGLTLAMMATMNGATSSVATEMETTLTAVDVVQVGVLGGE